MISLRISDLLIVIADHQLIIYSPDQELFLISRLACEVKQTQILYEMSPYRPIILYHIMEEKEEEEEDLFYLY